jgi:hypothetical protein
LAWWPTLELHTKCKPKRLFEGWSCFSWGELWVDQRSWILQRGTSWWGLGN